MTDPQPTSYDSRPDTLLHSLRVGALMVQIINDLNRRSVAHDLSKTRDPEVATFDQFTPRLAGLVFGSDEYKECLDDMGTALDHHYAHNAHHPQHHPRGINGMTLMDLVEMLADWRASTERVKNGNLRTSIIENADRFKIEPQLVDVLVATADQLGWFDPDPTRIPPSGTELPEEHPAWLDGNPTPETDTDVR